MVDRPGFNFESQLKMISKLFRLGARHERNNAEKKPAIPLAVTLMVGSKSLLVVVAQSN